MPILHVAADLLREAARRKWFLALGIGITAVLLLLGLTLRMDVVDGALTATRLFGSSLNHDMRSAEVALGEVFAATSYVIYYGGLVFGMMACADFAPALLAPGRIEHLLSLPVRRTELLLGTFLGVMVLCAIGTLYGALGFTLLLSIKSGVWTLMPVVASSLVLLAFAPLYAVMLCVAVFVRSAALSAGIAVVVFIGGIVASHRDAIAELMSSAAGIAFKTVAAPLPKIGTLADESAAIAMGSGVTSGLWFAVFGALLFAAAGLSLGVWRFQRRDF